MQAAQTNSHNAPLQWSNKIKRYNLELKPSDHFLVFSFSLLHKLGPNFFSFHWEIIYWKIPFKVYSSPVASLHLGLLYSGGSGGRGKQLCGDGEGSDSRIQQISVSVFVSPPLVWMCVCVYSLCNKLALCPWIEAQMWPAPLSITWSIEELLSPLLSACHLQLHHDRRALLHCHTLKQNKKVKWTI